MEDNQKIINVDRIKMEALEELARTNMLVSDAHTELANIKNLEASYLVEREAKAIAVVDKVLEESEVVLKQALENYEAIESVAQNTRDLSSRTIDLFNALKSIMSRFDEKSALWLKNIQDREDKLEESRKVLVLQKKQLDNDRKSLDERSLELTAAEQKLALDREEVAKMFKIKEVK